MGFYDTIQMFSKENEKKVAVFLLFDRNGGNGVGFTLYLYICARWEIIDGIVFMESGISCLGYRCGVIYGINEGSATIRYNTE